MRRGWLSEYRQQNHGIRNNGIERKSEFLRQLYPNIFAMFLGSILTLLGSFLALYGVQYTNLFQYKSGEIERAEKNLQMTQDALLELQDNLVDMSKSLNSKMTDDKIRIIRAVIADIPNKRRKFMRLHTGIAMSFGVNMADLLIDLNPLHGTDHSETVSCRSDDQSVANSSFELYVKAACAIALTAAAEYPVVATETGAEKIQIKDANARNIAISYERMARFEMGSSAFQYNIISYLNSIKPTFIGGK